MPNGHKPNPILVALRRASLASAAEERRSAEASRQRGLARAVADRELFLGMLAPVAGGYATRRIEEEEDRLRQQGVDPERFRSGFRLSKGLGTVAGYGALMATPLRLPIRAAKTVIGGVLRAGTEGALTAGGVTAGSRAIEEALLHPGEPRLGPRMAKAATTGFKAGAPVGAVLGGGLAGLVRRKALLREVKELGERGSIPSGPPPVPPTALEGAPLPTPKAEPIPPTVARPDVDQFVNVSKYDFADPSGEMRLRQEVSRLIETKGLAPKRVEHWDEVRAVAADLGLEVEALAVGTGPLAAKRLRLNRAELLGIRNLVSKNLDDMGEYAKATADPATAPVTRAAAEVKLRALDQQNTILLDRMIPTASRMGRDLNSLKMIANRAIDNAPLWLAKAKAIGGDRLTPEIAAEIGRLSQAGDREGMMGLLMNLQQASRGEKLTTFFKANILTNPVTHMVNVGSNTVLAGLEQGKNAPAALADQIMSLQTGTRTVSGPSFQELRASGAGARQGLQEAVRMLRTGQPPAEVLQRFDIPRQINYDNKILDAYTKGVFGALGAEDRIFRGAAYRGSLVNQARALAPKGPQLDALLREPTDAMVLRAIADAEEAVVADPTRLGKALGSLAKLPGGQFVIPFTRTPAAVAVRTLEYSPFGLLKGTADVFRVMTGGLPPEAQREAAKLFGRGVTGTSLVALGAWLRGNGLLTTNIPTGQQGEKETRQLLGLPAAAVKVGNEMVSLQRLTPLGNLIVLGGDLYDAFAKGQGPGEIAAQAGASVGQSLLNQPFVSGIQRVLTGTTTEPSLLLRQAQATATGFVPAASLVAGVARATDPTIREPKTFSEAVQARIPGLSRQVPAALTQFGRPARRESGLLGALNALVLPTPITTAPNDPLLTELGSIGATIPRRRPSKEVPRPLVRELVTVEGPVLRQALTALIASPEYQALSPEGRLASVESNVAGLRAKALIGQQRRDVGSELRRLGSDLSEEGLEGLPVGRLRPFLLSRKYRQATDAQKRVLWQEEAQRYNAAVSGRQLRAVPR